ncbi:MAG: hypothetical protein KIT83_16595 [Bryobacterales bacterium]|nr:hypothetical protein [Bryobacterales bacterium]
MAAPFAGQSPANAATEGKPAKLPTIKIGKFDVSRLIVGGNPFYGYSHFNRLYSEHMKEWATPERVVEVLRQCEAHGINTWQFSHTERTISDLKRHRDAGGKMNWILLSHAEIENNHGLIKEVAKLGPVGIVHHGGSAERKRREGKIQEVKDFLKAVRDHGVQVGLSTHDPEFLDQAESENWDVDFYMTALYYLTRSGREFEKLLGQRPLGEVYLPEDPARMCKSIRQTRKPCLTYKVLAAGRLADTPKQIDAAFQFAFDNMKANDAIIIGMYPRYFDQVSDNAQRVRKILGKKA